MAARKKKPARAQPRASAETASPSVDTFAGEWVFDPTSADPKGKRTARAHDKALVVGADGRVAEWGPKLSGGIAQQRAARGKLDGDALHVAFRGSREPRVLRVSGEKLVFTSRDDEHGRNFEVVCWRVPLAAYEAEVAARQAAETARGARKAAAIEGTAITSADVAPAFVSSPSEADLAGESLFVVDGRAYELAEATLFPAWDSTWNLPTWSLSLTNRPYKPSDDRAIGITVRLVPLGLLSAPVLAVRTASEPRVLAKPKSKAVKLAIQAWAPGPSGRAAFADEAACVLRLADLEVGPWKGKAGAPAGRAHIDVFVNVRRVHPPEHHAVIRASLEATVRLRAEPRWK